MMDSAWLAASALAALALTLWLVTKRRVGAPHSAREDALDTIAGWPPQAVRVLTLAERQAYEIVRRAMPRHLVLAQVPLARFISVPTSNPYTAWLNRAGRLSVDLLVTDAASRPVAAVQVLSAGMSDRGAKRQARLAAVLRAAGVSVHTWHEDRLPSADEARVQLLGDAADSATQALDDAGAGSLDGNGRRVLPVAHVEEMLAAGDDRDYGHDPVASTFFDDLDPLATAH